MQQQAGYLSFGQSMGGGVDYSTVQGPGDEALERNEAFGYSLVSRNGELAVNSFVDTQEWSLLKPQVTCKDVGIRDNNNNFESRPMFADWASTLPGMVCVARKNRTDTWRRNLVAEAATPVISSAACLGAEDEFDWFFAGVCRSKIIVPHDDGIGPKIDEFFTLFVGGMVTVLNTSGARLCAGDHVAW